MTIEQFLGKSTSVRISSLVIENDEARTAYFELPRSEINIHPGQFFMVWVPGIDEIPMSISFWKPALAGITVQPVGDATNALASMSEGDWLGIRGPFGTHFTPDSKKALLVGGGIGMAPLRLLVPNLHQQGAEITLIIAAKTKKQLLYLHDFNALIERDMELKVATDDGSMGFKGLATEAAEEVLQKGRFDTLYTCGPESMMVGLYNLAEKEGIRFQASLERYMKCGCGLCGTCALDPTGDLVCVDGPVFNGEQLSKIEEFGKYARDEVGIKRKIES